MTPGPPPPAPPAAPRRAPAAIATVLPWLVAALDGVIVLCAFLPWVRTGSAERSSYRLLRDLTTLGVLHGSKVAAGRVVWVLLPAIAALSVLLITLHRVRSGAALAVAAALIGAGGVIVVVRSPVHSLVGVTAMAVAAPLAIVAAAATLIVHRRWGPGAEVA